MTAGGLRCFRVHREARCARSRSSSGSGISGRFSRRERMVPDGVPGEAVHAELSRFVASLGIDAEQTGQTYDVLVRGLLTSA